MKILEIIPHLNSGGAERFVVDLCNELAKAGHKVFLMTLYSLEKYPELNFYGSDLSSQVEVISLNKRGGFDLRTISEVNNVICKIKPDIVHTHLRALTYVLLPVFTKHKIYYFHTIHNDAQKEAGDLINRICRRILFKFNKVYPITISRSSDKSFDVFYGRKVRRHLIVNGSIKPEGADKMPEEIKRIKELGKNVIVNVARVFPQKNQLSLCKAAEAFPDIDFLIVGNDTDAYAKKVKECAPNNLYVLGSRKSPRAYMKYADAFILSSEYEGMPITLIECFSVGAIPIVTPVGGMVDMVKDGYNGIVCKGTSPQDIIDGIERFVQLSIEEIALMKMRSLESFEDYSIENSATHYISLFKKSILTL